MDTRFNIGTQLMIEKLEKYAQLEGSELGDYCRMIIALYSRPECISAEFRPHLDAEAWRLLKDFKEYFTIEKCTICPKPYEIEELVEK